MNYETNKVAVRIQLSVRIYPNLSYNSYAMLNERGRVSSFINLFPTKFTKRLHLVDMFNFLV